MISLRANLGLLPILHVVLEECSVTRAAVRLGLTQSAVSQALTRARDVWQDELLVRHGQRMIPTPLATELAIRLEAWVGDTTALLSAPTADPRLGRATVVIVANDYSEISLMPPVLKVLSESAPGVTTVLRSIEAHPLDSEDFLAGHVHFALAGVQPPQGPFEVAPLFTEHFVMIARHGHPGIGREMTLERYLGFQHALVSPQGKGVSGPIDMHLAELGVSRHVALSLTRFTSLPYLLASTDMVATVPSRFAALPEVRNACQAVALPFQSPTFAMSLIWHRRYRNDPLHGWLRGVMLAMIGQG